MPNIRNLGRFVAADTPSLTRDGKKVLVVCVAGRFSLPTPGGSEAITPEPLDEQTAPSFEDVYAGEPGASSLLFEGQSAYVRPGTDIYLTGHAFTPRGRPKNATMVEVRVGPCRKRVAVFGDRSWTRNGSGERFSTAEPFESMPLLYERAFGGTADPSKGQPAQWEPRNPVGRGFYASKAEALDKPLPNLEDPNDLVTTFRSRPAPCGLGPVARNWQPRLAHAGTYDEAWVSERAPLWPVDFDERFFCAASPGLTSAKHLSGGELALLSGVSPDGDYALTLPRVRLQAKARFRKREERRLMVLDAIHFEPARGDRGSFTMIWRASFGVVRDLLEHESTLVRELEPWEDAPP